MGVFTANPAYLGQIQCYKNMYFMGIIFSYGLFKMKYNIYFENISQIWTNLLLFAQLQRYKQPKLKPVFKAFKIPFSVHKRRKIDNTVKFFKAFLGNVFSVFLYRAVKFFA